jgi:hypothetical protein
MSFRYGLQDGSFGVLAVNSSEGPGPAGYLRDLRDLTRCWCVLLNLLLCCNVPYISRPSSAITKMPRNPTLHRVCRALVDCKTGIIGLNVGWAALQQDRKVSVYLSDWATNPMVALLTCFMFQHCMAAYFFAMRSWARIAHLDQSQAASIRWLFCFYHFLLPPLLSCEFDLLSEFLSQILFLKIHSWPKHVPLVIQYLLQNVAQKLKEPSCPGHQCLLASLRASTQWQLGQLARA